MATFRMKYVKAYEDRHGRMRYYYRRPGFPVVSLPGAPGGKAFAEAYEAAGSNAPRKIGEDRVEPGTFNALIAEYYETAAFTTRADITRKTYRNAIERFRNTFGDMPVKAMTPKRVDELLEDTPKNKEVLRKVLRLLLKLAVRRHYIKINPMDGLRLDRKPQKGFHTWSEEEIAAYEAKWPSGSRERLALALLLYTAQRRADVVTMGRQHVRDGTIRVQQSKTGTVLWVPIHPHLQAELDQIPAGQLTFLQTQYGQPFSPPGFTNWFRFNCDDAALPKGCSPHGLRKAACVRLAQAGCTPHEIMAVTGHKNLAEVTVYTQAADQQKLAAGAMRKTEGGTEVSTPVDEVRQKAGKTRE
jgi:integrase